MTEDKDQCIPLKDGDILWVGKPGETPPVFNLRWRDENGREYRLPLEVREAGGEDVG